jgi:hypothetical protein
MTAEDVILMSASLLNDQIQSIFTNSVQIPYLNMAMRELGQKLELNNVPVTNSTSAVLPVLSGDTSIALPNDLVDIQQIWQRATGTSVPFIPVARYEFLPHFWDSIETSVIPAWAWMEQEIKIIPSNTDTDVKIDYIKSILPEITSITQPITVLNSQNYLGYKTAALCAAFIGENNERALILNQQAELMFSEILGIATKGKQAIVNRRRPFMASWKNRGIW